MGTKNYNADIAHCCGQNCPLREKCKRYRLYCMIATIPILRYSECTAVIDTNNLDGEVMEIPYQEFKEWWDNNYRCLGVTGL